MTLGELFIQLRHTTYIHNIEPAYTFWMVNQARVLRNSINPEVKNLPDEILKGKSVSVFALIFQTQFYFSKASSEFGDYYD